MPESIPTRVLGPDDFLDGLDPRLPDKRVASTAALSSRAVLPLLFASIIGSLLVVPYSIALLKQTKGLVIPEGGLPMVMAASVIFEVGLSAVSIILGLKLGPRAGLGTPLLVGVERHFPDRTRTRRAIVLAVVFGIASAAAIIASAEGLHAFLPGPNGGFKTPAPWASFLGSIGAGIREEVWLRFGFMTFVTWLGARLFGQNPARPTVIWLANIFAAFLFGAIHLPQAQGIIGLTGPLVAFVLIGNGLPGIVFGWLYWRKGLIAAMISHATADIVLKVIYPLLAS